MSNDDQDFDDQDTAEAFDEDMIGSDAVTSDQTAFDFPPDRPHGIQFADADVTDESFAERTAQEEPEVWETDLARAEVGGTVVDPIEEIEAEVADG